MNCKRFYVPLSALQDLSKSQCPKTMFDMLEMEHVPYDNAVRSVMYAMICIRPDMSYNVSLLSRYTSNP